MAIDYEELRKNRILENKARLASLGLQQTISDLRAITASAKPIGVKKAWPKKVYSLESLRRSDRLKKAFSSQGQTDGAKSLRRSIRLKHSKDQSACSSPTPAPERSCAEVVTGQKIITPANKPLLYIDENMEYELTPEASAMRCKSKKRGKVYDPIFGICCHFCRQKTLCCEEDCKRCGNLDVNEPCIGKTDCSVCHSSMGVLCRACLKVRYGEEIEEVRENRDWKCPHCIEAEGKIPFWICNSSFCLRKRDKLPTGIAIHRAQKLGYKSVAHLLMDELQRAAGKARLKP